jgi:glutamyl-tRNA synthetase
MMEKTRLAPSPTGALHLGNARTFLINWLIARQRGWKIVLRVEDLDGPRVKRGADVDAMQDLRWLGLDWDEGPIHQSQRAGIYADAIQRLVNARHAYPCICTRREAALASSAPHAEDGAGIYPGTCRDRFKSVEEARAAAGREPAIRFRVPADPIELNDAVRGRVRFDAPAMQLGDFVIAKADGTAAYQLAVVVDDADMGITQVVRGDDLLDSTPRQILLYRALGWERHIPTYTHVPLVVGRDGRRLAKRHGDTRLAHYRAIGVDAPRLLALLARWCGRDGGNAVSLEHLLDQWNLDQLPRTRVVMTADDERFLVMPPG